MLNRANAKRKALFARRKADETEDYSSKLQAAAVEGENGETDEERGEREKKADAAERRAVEEASAESGSRLAARLPLRAFVKKGKDRRRR